MSLEESQLEIGFKLKKLEELTKEIVSSKKVSVRGTTVSIRLFHRWANLAFDIMQGYEIQTQNFMNLYNNFDGSYVQFLACQGIVDSVQDTVNRNFLIKKYKQHKFAV